MLITDHRMLPITGADLIRELKAANFAIPMVMISDNPMVKDEAFRAGADEFLEKAEIRRLPDVIRAHLVRTGVTA